MSKQTHATASTHTVNQLRKQLSTVKQELDSLRDTMIIYMDSHTMGTKTTKKEN